MSSTSSPSTSTDTSRTRYPAREHARKTIGELAKLIPAAERTRMHAILLQAPGVESRHDTDRELPFHQEANFTYLTGYPHPSAAVLICFALEPSLNAQHILFVPPAVPEETMWSVAPPTLDEAKAAFDSDSVLSLDELAATFSSAAGCDPSGLILHTLPQTLEYPALPDILGARAGAGEGKGKVDHRTDLLLDALHLARLTKTPYEVELVREANRISSNAHEVLMRTLGRFARARAEGKEQGQGEVGRTGKEALGEWEVEGEADGEAIFVAACRRQGASQAYLPIVASGSRAATLHYVCNDRVFPSMPRVSGDKSFKRATQRGCCVGVGEHHGYAAGTPIGEYHSDGFEPQVLLVDAGGEWQNYAADITRTLPVGNGGKFTQEAGVIYDLVLRMQKECEDLVRPGAHWDAIHLHGHRVLIDGFLSLGILTGSPEDILQSGITAAFFPHGLGHSLGLDVHDSRQYLRAHTESLPESSKTTPEKLYAYLRIRRPLEEGMVLTVEPGCYFPPQLMALHGVWESEYVVKGVLERYTRVGGVRIEDAVLVTKEGSENLTLVARERAWVEGLCSGKEEF